MAIVIQMPHGSQTMETGTIVKWHKNVGDTIMKGDILADVETDKAVIEVQSTVDGTLTKIIIDVGIEVPVEEPIAIVGTETEDLDGETDAPKQAEQEPTYSSDKKTEKKEIVKTPSLTKGFFASPLAKRVAREKGIDLTGVVGTGPKGRIKEQDVLDCYHAQKSSPDTNLTPPVSLLKDQPIAMSKMRRTISDRMVESSTKIPHFYITKMVNVTSLVEMREKQSELYQQKYSNFSLTDFVIAATAKTLKRYPNLNASSDDGENITFHSSINIGLVAKCNEGIIIPVIPNADQLTPAQLVSLRKKIVAEAQQGKLSNPDVHSTFTISNMGPYDIDSFTGIINYPQCALLTVGSAQEQVIVDHGAIRIASVITLNLSCDHRVVDGIMGAQFVNTIANFLCSPCL